MGFMDQFKDTMGAGMPTAADMAYMQKVTKLNDSGIEHPAKITGLRSTGRSDSGGGVEYEVDVDVAPEGGEAYSTTFLQYMHEGSMGSWATEGAAVKVRVDPDDPNSMILWGGAT